MQHQDSDMQADRRWSLRLAAIAAAVLVMTLAGGFLAVSRLGGPGERQSGAPIAAETGTSPADAPAAGLAAPPAGPSASTEAGPAADSAAGGSAAGADSAAGDGVAALNAAARSALFTFPAITDGVPRMAKPDAVRGLYLNAWAAGSTRRLASLIDIANRTEINTFVIDVKEGGQVSYRSRVPLARQIDADQAHIRDIRGVLRQLHENGIYTIARIVVFRDAVLAQARPEMAVRHVNGGEWIDHYGHRWVDSFNRDVWDYNIAIAREALQLGFSEIQWDYVRFPDVPRSLMRQAHWPAAAERSRAEGIRQFLLYSRDQLAEYGAPVTADVFGLTVSARDDMGIGQLWEKMVDATDVLLPMVYPSHFARGSYGIAHPNAEPYEVVHRAMVHAVRRTRGVDGAATIRPWLQDFTLGQPRYGPEHVRAQIEAVHAAGLTEWVLWHPGSNYTVEALAAADGTPPVLGRPAAPPPSAGRAAPRERRTAPLGDPVGSPR
jgi:hypothetical protein